ncbi:MAG: HAD-IC family P-type ATPase [Acidimicrobiales bacterium]|nr:HAD-IC family P-type ATPase [Acidimicrobiales bacterium]
MAVIRLGRRKILVQELAAVEGLARVDTVCLDKTGTLTQGGIDLERIEYVGTMPEHDARTALAAFAASDPNPNPTQQAVADALPPPEEPWPVASSVPFSSVRKWSSVTFAPDPGYTFVFGAPDVILAGYPIDDPVRHRSQELAATGRRVLLFARAPSPPVGETLPDGLEPVALLSLNEQLRPDARETLAFFRDQDVAIKVISGDNPVTVAAVAREVGVPNAETGVDARELATDSEALADQLERNAVFGRVQPQQKQSMVKALQSRSHTVAMTGDGVNDVLALKDADIGVAMGSGSPASRAVAQLVLLDGRYTSLPLAVAEGRRVIANIERVATLFLAKNAYAATLAVLSFIAAVEFPFLPRHLTLVNAVTIGIPGFFLSLAPAAERAQTGFVRRVMFRSVPAGAITGLAVFAVFAVTLGNLSLEVTDETKQAASSVAVAALLAIGLFIVYLVARPMTKPRLMLLSSLAALAALAFVVPPVREYFALDLPNDLNEFEGLLVIPPAVVALELAWRWTNRWIEGRANVGPLNPDEWERSSRVGLNDG